jgi:hypothetical protein
MRAIISFVLLLALIPCTVFAAQKANIKTMCQNAAMQKYVVRLEKNHKASVCTLESYRGEGDYCGSNFGEMWSQILDLNNDLNFDIILEDRSAGCGAARTLTQYLRDVEMVHF